MESLDNRFTSQVDFKSEQKTSAKFAMNIQFQK